MPSKMPFLHPYIPNAEPRIKRSMLEAIGAESIEELYEDIPPELRFQGLLDVPPAIHSEAELARYISELLKKNENCQDNLSFLGGGCYHHYVPAICDEINARGEFLTAYAGKTYTDHGKFQALFEFTSMMGELLNMDVISIPTYDGYQAAATSLRMAGRITGRQVALVPQNISPRMLAKFRIIVSPTYPFAHCPLSQIPVGWTLWLSPRPFLRMLRPCSSKTQLTWVCWKTGLRKSSDKPINMAHWQLLMSIQSP